MTCPGRHVPIDDTRLWVVERGEGFPLLVLHGGPGLDHHEFADHLDPLGDRYRLILLDQRSQGRSDRAPERTWTLERMAQDVIMLARALELERYAVLGHSFGAFVALQHAIDFPAMAAATILSSGVASMRWFDGVEDELDALEPPEVRERVRAALEREGEVRTAEDCDAVVRDQWPFSFADPLDPRIPGYAERSRGEYSPELFRFFAREDALAIELEDRLGDVAQPVLVLAGRRDRVCPPGASEAIAAGIPGAELVVFERSGHMSFVEEPEAYLAAVRSFLDRHRG